MVRGFTILRNNKDNAKSRHSHVYLAMIQRLLTYRSAEFNRYY